MNNRSAVAIAALSLLLGACSAIGARPSGSPADSPASSPAPTTPSPAATPTTPPSTTPETPKPSHDTSNVEGREFVSVLVTEDGKTKVLAAGTKLRLGFSDGKLTASAGCNTMSGDYTHQDGRLVIGEMATTEIGCPSDLGRQEQWLADFLDSKPKLALNGNELVLTSDSDEITFQDREQAEPDQPLTGITWGLTTLIDGETASSVPEGVSPTLLFNADGSFTFNDGCNAGGGQYVVDGDELHFSQVVSTMMACPGDRGQVSSAVRAVLSSDTVQYSIDHATLSLKSGSHGLDYDAALDVTN